MNNTHPKLHNAMWPGLVGKGSPGAEPCLSLDTMLDLTAKAEVNGVKFDGVDLFLFDPHVSIDSADDDLRRLADNISAKGFTVGSVVAPVWPPTGGGSAMGGPEDRQKFVGQVRKACRIAKRLRELGVRSEGVVRIDSACGVEEWSKAPLENTRRIARTFREACHVAEFYGERLAAEGEICWGGMHSWKKVIQLLEMVERPQTLGFQADMAHTLLFVLAHNAPEDALLPANWDWTDRAAFDEAYQTVVRALRPWTFDFHVAQNDATVKGSGTHDKTGRHCLPDDPNGKLDIVKYAGFWLRDDKGQPTKTIKHLCWDGCMFPNEVMMKPETWNSILAAMMAVREAHGRQEEVPAARPTGETVAEVLTRIVKQEARKEVKARKPVRKPAPKKKSAKHAKSAKKTTARKTVKKAAKKVGKKAKPARKTGKRSAVKKTVKKANGNSRANHRREMRSFEKTN